jgi:hypothetical protein
MSYTYFNTLCKHFIPLGCALNVDPVGEREKERKKNDGRIGESKCIYHRKRRSKAMSLEPQAISPIPEETARVARAIFSSGNRSMRLRDELGTIYTDEQFVALYPAGGQFAEQPWRMALVAVRH